jgi:hypothetical protein
VLLVAPSTGATASLYTDDEEYELLAQALGDDPAPEANAPGEAFEPRHDGVNITWLVHDVAVWRTDHVIASADNPWIQTRISSSGEIGLDDPGVWHHAANPKLLLSLLDRLGVLERATASVTDPVGAQAPVVPAPAAGGTSEPAVDGGSRAWLWFLPGLLAGVLIGAVARPAAGLRSRIRQRTQQGGPRQRLVDL